MMHQMNRRGVVRRADDGDGLSPRAYQQRHSPAGGLTPAPNVWDIGAPAQGRPTPTSSTPQESRPSPPSERRSARYRSRIDDLPAEGSSSGVQ